MRNYLSYAILMLGTLALPAFSVDSGCLQQATNEELLRELSYRLHTGDTSSATSARATYVCDTNTYLTIRLLPAVGAESSLRFYIGDQALCDQQASSFLPYSRIRSNTELALCDSNTYLHRVQLYPDGTLKELDKTYIGDSTRCRQQATAIVAGN